MNREDVNKEKDKIEKAKHITEELSKTEIILRNLNDDENCKYTISVDCKYVELKSDKESRDELIKILERHIQELEKELKKL